MSSRRSAVLLSSLLFVFPVFAQAQQADPFREVLQVALTSVDVVAVDKSGNPVTGLAAADFEIYEDGKRQEITHFAEVAGVKAAVAPAGASALLTTTPATVARKFIFYIDDVSLTVENRRAIFPAIRKFLATQLREGDRAMLVTWNGDLKVRVPWTGDLAALNTALDALAVEAPISTQIQAEKLRAERLLTRMAEDSSDLGGGGRAAVNPMKPSWNELVNAARAYAEAVQNDVSRSTNALIRLLGSLPGVEGRKILVMATESLPTQAGAELFAHLENIRATILMTPTSSFTNEARRSTQITDTSRYNVTPVLNTLVRAANATDVTVYGINPKGLDAPASGNVEGIQPRELNVEFTRNVQTLSGINLLASQTGGVAMVGAPAETALERMSRELNGYYSLAYRVTPGASAERSIEVRSKRPGVKVRSRTSIYYRSLEREMIDRVIANHLQSELPNELRIALEADPVTSSDGRQFLPVRILVPLDKLTLLPDGQGNVAGGLSVFSCSGDGAGGTSDVSVQSKALRLTPEQIAQLKGQRIWFTLQVPIDKSKHQVSVGVVDHVSYSQGFATVKAAL